MNQEKLADLLADHLDLVLEEKQLPATPPAEIAPLLAVAEALAATAPVPRPEFGPTLKESLLGPASGGNGGSAGTGGASFGGHVLLVIVVGLLALAVGLTLLVGTVIVGLTRSADFDSPSPLLLPVQTRPTPAQAIRSPGPPPSPTVPVTPDVTSDSLFSPPVMATVVLDILPAITNTVETAKELPLPSDLSSGQSSSDDDDGDGGDRDGGHRGDHNRGHGNDPDRHDDDNPGHSK